MTPVKADLLVKRFENAVVNYARKGTRDPLEIDDIELEYAVAREAMMAQLVEGK